VSEAPASHPWTREALRLNARYVDEIVIGWGLCPWAAPAWRAGAVRRRVSLDRAPDPASVLAFLDQLAADPDAAIGLFICPRASLDAAAFGRFAEQVRRARPAPPFLIAAFHPQLREQPPADAASLVPFIRRTPDPTLQLVRAQLLDDLARGGRDVSADVARANFAAVGARTPAALDRALRDIQRDRDDSYARLAASGAAID
jgi:hypothetical protein